MQQHRDYFDLLRLIAASFVLWTHQFALSGLPEPHIASLHTSWGGIGVFMFFAMAGYLNGKSLMRRRQFAPFLLARVLRIYPAIIVCTSLMLILGAFITTLDPISYMTETATWRFAVSNMALVAGPIHGILPGVFTGNPAMNAVNGSIWTLPYELACYLLFACVAAAVAYRQILMAALLLVPIGLAVARFEVPWFQSQTFLVWPAFVGLCALFSVGAMMAILEDRVSKSASYSAALLVVTILLLYGDPYHAGLLALGAATIVIGQQRAPAFAQLPHDISYGVYIYAFPVQQIVLSVVQGFWLSLAIIAPAVVILAYASCRLVEESALELKEHIYRRGWRPHVASAILRIASRNWPLRRPAPLRHVG